MRLWPAEDGDGGAARRPAGAGDGGAGALDLVEPDSAEPGWRVAMWLYAFQ
jgi:hypothetical protein